MKQKKGVTLIEVMVAMGIFTVIAAMAIAVFVSVLNLKTMSSNMKESQQKLRITLEMVTRLARQANKIIVSDDKKTVFIYYNYPASATKFEITGTSPNMSLMMADCEAATLVGRNCGLWRPQTLISNPVRLDSNSRFEKEIFADKSGLIVKLSGLIDGTGLTNDTFSIETEVVLENEK